MTHTFYQPQGGNDMPRSGGINTMMRLPVQDTANDLHACFVGIPLDIGTSHKSGTRFGPRHIRQESAMLRPYHMYKNMSPFDSLQVADLGDVPVNLFDLKKNTEIIENFYTKNILQYNCIPLTLGGDHSISYPILRAVAKKYGPVAVLHVDAHSDTNENMFGEPINHGSFMRNAWRDGCVQNNKVFQMGLRGTGYTADDFNWGCSQGWTVYPAEDIWYKSVSPIMADIKQKIGDTPVYISYDIDSLDPAYAPGTGTMEVGGLTSIQALEIIRGCAGMHIVGGDLVEVSPPYDIAGKTAYMGANILYEMLCLLPENMYLKKDLLL